MQAGFIGLGAMAANLHRAGLLAAVHNRSADVAARFADAYGVPALSDPAALAERCDLVVICVSADDDVLSVIRALTGGLQSGSLVVDCSTIAADSARKAAQMVAAADAIFMDAPVSGGTEGAQRGTLTMMVGADDAAIATARPALQAMGETIVHMGPVGAGQSTKAVNQVMAAGINQAVTEAMAFASALDLPLDKLVDVVGSGAAGNWFVNHRGASMVAGNYDGFGFKLALHHKDLRICSRMAQAVGGSLPSAEHTLRDYETLMAAGHGDEDIFALYRVSQRLFDDNK